jgi:hypothetical protein
MLVALADMETPKTVPQSTKDLENVLTTDGYQSDGSRLKQAIEAALDNLEKKELVRKRLDPDTCQHMWLLDHDYLCRGVLEVERRANRWFALAQEGSRSFHDAGHYPWRRWQTLLNPWQQGLLAIQRIRGRFRYADLRLYALWSLLRFIPYLLVLAAISAGWITWSRWQQAEQIRNMAGQIRDVIGLSERLTPRELEFLWKLAQSDDAIHDSFLQQALASQDKAEQFSRRIDMTIQAMVGLNPRKREAIWKYVERLCLEPPAAERFIKRVCARIGIALAEEKPTFTLFAVRTLVEDMAETTNVTQLRSLAAALTAVPGQLPVTEAQQAHTAILAVLAKTTDGEQLRFLAEALKTVPGQLPVTEAQQTYTAILAVLAKTTNVTQLRSLAAALTAVLSQLPVTEAQQAHTAILAVLAKTTDVTQPRSLAAALTAVLSQLPVTEAQQAYTAILAVMAKTPDPRQLRFLAAALTAVPGQLSVTEAQQAHTAILAVLAKTTDVTQQSLLAEALKAVPGQLSVTEARQAYTAILAVLAKTTDSEQLRSLAAALTAVPGQLDRQTLIDLLKWPVSIEAFRASLLGMLEQQLGLTFHGNLWEMVAWAQKNNLDVGHPPPKPTNN